MPDLKPTALPVLTSLASGDIVAVVDVSDTTDDAAGSDKQITGANLATSLASLGTFATDTEVTAAVAAHTGDSTAAHAASAISFSATGTIAGTDVQTAVAEVATDAATALTTHEADTTSVHGIADTSALVTTSTVGELVRDTMGTALVAGSNVTITVSDPGDTITIAASGGGGSFSFDDSAAWLAAQFWS